MKVFNILAAILFFMIHCKVIYSDVINMPLYIEELLPPNTPGHSRTNAPVTFGIPLAEGLGISSVNQLALQESNEVQFRVLDRWSNGDIRWLLIDTQVSSLPDRITELHLVNGSGPTVGAPLASDFGSYIKINTGAAEFAIKKANFNFVDEVTAGGNTIVATHSGGGISGIDQNGAVYLSSLDNSSISKIEENGTLRAVILSQGSIKNQAGNSLINYTLRFHFYKNHSWFKVYTTLRNAEENNLNPVYFNSFEIIIPYALAGSKSVKFGTNKGVFQADLGAGDTYIYQALADENMLGLPDGNYLSSWPLPESETGFDLKISGRTINSLGSKNDRSLGWTSVYSSTNSIHIGCRWMSEYWPSGFEFKNNDEISIELYSKRNSKKNLKFAWGAHDTREIAIGFDISDEDFFYNLYYPLNGKTDFSAYVKSGVIYGENVLVDQSTETKFRNSLGNSDMINDRRPMAVRWWYWPTTGEYNIIERSLLDIIRYLRDDMSGRYLFSELWVNFISDCGVRHSDGFDMSTITLPSDYYNMNTGSVINFPPLDGAHNQHWTSMPLYYYLTGDERVKEAIYDYGENLYDSWELDNYNWTDMRVWSRLFRNLAFIYEFTRSQKAKSSLDRMINTLLYTYDDPNNHQQHGRNLERGFIWIRATENHTPRHTHTFFLSTIHCEAVYQVMRILPVSDPRKEELKDYLTGLSQFIFNEMYGERNNGNVLYDYGYPDPYYLDQVNDFNQGGYLNPGILLPMQSSRIAVLGYKYTAEDKYLDLGKKIIGGLFEYIGSEYRSIELETHYLIHHLESPDTVWKQINSLTVTNLGSGAYRLSWTVPKNAYQYQIKYSDKPIVSWLEFNQSDRSFKYPPVQYTPFFAAQNVTDEPDPGIPDANQTYNISGLNPATNYYFMIKYSTISRYGTGSKDIPSAPTGLKIMK